MKARILSPATRTKMVLGSTPNLDKKIQTKTSLNMSKTSKKMKIMKTMVKLDTQYYANLITSADTLGKCDEQQEQSSQKKKRPKKKSIYPAQNFKVKQDSTETNTRPKNSARKTQSPLQSKIDTLRSRSRKQKEIFSKFNLKANICGVNLKNLGSDIEMVQDILVGIMACEADPYLQPLMTNTRAVKPSPKNVCKTYKLSNKKQGKGTKRERNCWKSTERTMTFKNRSTRATSNLNFKSSNPKLYTLNTHRTTRSKYCETFKSSKE
ncbi:unnamed protein product [Moneuplotes crassus]|uniref:Uncharacterized protein n=1 Tax=Euplotes crassus TaxID=5936 RepID=A0AAD1Y4A6_EUPCR|nr:unnamed protein product [Moneuplotes crassus]